MGIINKSDIHNYKVNLYERQFPQRNIFINGIETFATKLSDISSRPLCLNNFTQWIYLSHIKNVIVFVSLLLFFFFFVLNFFI